MRFGILAYSMPSLELIGSVSGEATYSPSQIRSALDAEPTVLGHGEAFTGRPGTRIYVVGADVMKLRTEIGSADAPAWAQSVLQRERKLRIHHGSKTWFVLKAPQTAETAVAGSICPLLVPLHVSWRDPPTDATDRQRRLRQLRALLHRHFEARACGFDLDLGLSNFGVDRSQQLFYLDDDVYPVDPEHASLGQMLAVYLRSQDWIDRATATAIGEMVNELLRREAAGGDSTVDLVGLLTQLYMPAGRPREALHGLTEALRRGIGPRSGRARTTAAPMRRLHQLAVLSDIHANLPALDAALDFVRMLGLNDVVVLGDVVGYGPHPVECIERLAETQFACLKGNHDYACSLEAGEAPAYPVAMSRDARWAVEWTAKRLTAEHRRWLRELPTSLQRNGWLAVHGAPIDPNRFNGYVYEMTYERNLDELHELALRTCFHGHTHVRGVYARARGKPDAFYAADSLPLEKYLHALVCPGSVGQPRNGMPGAQLAVYDRESRVVQFYSIAYPMDRTIADMQRHGFPNALVDRLQTAT